jgi:hypothetical protein
MEVRPVQFNINSKSAQPSEKKEHKPYLEAEGVIKTDNLVKPLPGKGHLIHDTILTGPRYFIKDIGYDIASVKNSYQGKVSDHQAGRLNDIGLKLGGVGIATYLASQTSNPKARIMEYVGLGAFLTAMDVYPKIAINKPAEWMHGHDIDKWYIDDQGRKKSVNQDSNYVPYDLYRGEAEGEDLDEIGDKMGIPRDLKNRHEVIKEQMRKIAIQSNTLWMLTAGLATPAMTALACCGLENYVISPALGKARNVENNYKIETALASTKKMSLNLDEISGNSLSSDVESILKNYTGKEIPKEEIDNIIEICTKDIDENAAKGIRQDLTKLFQTSAGKKSVIIDPETVNAMVESAKNTITKSNKEMFEPVLVPTKQEIIDAIKRVSPSFNFEENSTIGVDELPKIKKELQEVIDIKLSGATNIPEEARSYAKNRRNEILEQFSKSMKTQTSNKITEDGAKNIVNFAKILGDFKANQKILDGCKSFKFEFAPETVVARAYGKFEKALLSELGVTYQEAGKMRNSREYTKEVLDKRLSDLCKDDTRYKKTMEKIGKIISQTEVELNGSKEVDSNIKDLIEAIENNYNNTAKRLSKLDGFETTIQKLVNSDVSSLESDAGKINSKQKLFDFLDGIVKNKFEDFSYTYQNDLNKLSESEQARIKELHKAYAEYNYKGLGSSKHQEISRIAERYQGVKNSFNRILHTLEVYKRTQNPAEFIQNLGARDSELAEKLAQEARKMLISANASDHHLKQNLVNNPQFYQDMMNSTYRIAETSENVVKSKGYVTDIAKEALEKENSLQKGNVLDRYQYYISRFKNIVSNGTIDFTKREHHLDEATKKAYTQADKTRMSFFNLIGQTPIDMVQGAADRKYMTQRWVKLIGGITAAVFAGTILAQVGFGKIRNPQNLKKQVQNETN